MSVWSIVASVVGWLVAYFLVGAIIAIIARVEGWMESPVEVGDMERAAVQWPYVLAQIAAHLAIRAVFALLGLFVRHKGGSEPEMPTVHNIADKIDAQLRERVRQRDGKR